jgi:hypothetical protein
LELCCVRILLGLELGLPAGNVLAGEDRLGTVIEGWLLIPIPKDRLSAMRAGFADDAIHKQCPKIMAKLFVGAIAYGCIGYASDIAHPVVPTAITGWRLGDQIPSLELGGFELALIYC